MKYRLDSKYKNAIMRNYLVKSFLSLMTLLAVMPAYSDPTAKTGLTYKGKEQPLVTADEVNVVEKYQYRIYGSDDVWSDEIPTAKDAGTYQVEWRKIESNKTELVDGYYVVDLGLPSGLKWASANLPSKNAHESGYYIEWGHNTESDKDDAKCYYWDNYKWGSGSHSLTKYVTETSRGTVDGLKVLEPEDDAATFNYGTGWHTPTREEFNELISACTWTWVEDFYENEVSGMLGVSKKNGNTIFLPGVGNWYKNYRNWWVNDDSAKGFYWTSDLNIKDNGRANCITFTAEGFRCDSLARHLGMPIRPVTKNTGEAWIKINDKGVTDPITISPYQLGVRWTQFDSDYCFTYDGEEHQPILKLYQDSYYEVDKDNVEITMTSTPNILPGDNYVATAELTGTAKDNYVIRESMLSRSYVIKKKNIFPKYDLSAAKSPLEYTGKDQYLFDLVPTSVSTGTIADGEWQFYVSTTLLETDEISESLYSSTMPTVKEPGTYYVYTRFVPKNTEVYNIYVTASSYTFTVSEVEQKEPDVIGPTVINNSPKYDCKGDYLINLGDNNGIDGSFYYWEGNNPVPTKPGTPPRWYDARKYVVHSKFVPTNTLLYKEVEFDDIVVEVKQRILTLKWEGLTHKYDGDYANPKATIADLTQLCGEDADHISVDVQGGEESEVGSYTVKAVLTGIVAKNYKINSLYETETLYIKNEVPVDKAPIGLEALYTGKPVNLITPGKNKIPGVWKYVVDTELRTIADSEYKDFDDDNLPQATKIGTYYVYLKFVPDDTDKYFEQRYDIKAWIVEGHLTPTVKNEPTVVADFVYDGKYHALLANTGDVGSIKGSFLYKVNNDTKYSSAYLSKTDAGTYTVYSCFVAQYESDGVIKDDPKYDTLFFDPQTVEIKAIEISLNWPTLQQTYDGKTKTLTITSDDILADDVTSVAIGYTVTSPANGVLKNVGSYTLKATLSGTKAKNYEIVSDDLTKTFKITKGTISSSDYTAPTAASGLVYNQSEQDLLETEGSTKKGTMKYLVDGEESENPQGKAAKTYTVSWYVDGGDNYNSTTKKSFEVSIDPKGVTVVWDSKDEFDYDENIHSVSINNVTGIITGDVVTWDVADDTRSSEIGKHTAKAILEGKDASNYTIAKNETKDYTIVEATLEFTAPKPNTTLTYNGEKQSLLLSEGKATTTPGTMYYALGTETEAPAASAYSKTLDKQKDGGTYYVYYKFVPTNTAIDPSEPALLTIKIRPVVLTTVWKEVKDHEYDGTRHRPTATFEGFVGTDEFAANVSYRETVEGSGVYCDGKSVGVQKVRADIPDDYLSNYTVEDDDRFNSYEITAKELSVVWTNTELPYKEGVEQAPTAKLDGVIKGDDVEAVVSGGKTEIGDDYKATATLSGDAAGNYTLNSTATTKFSIISNVADFTAPTMINDLVYNGKSQKLINPGKVGKVDGKFEYCFDENDATSTDYYDTIPCAKNRGVFYIQWRFIPTDVQYESTTDRFLYGTIQRKKIEVDWGDTIFEYNKLAQGPAPKFQSGSIIAGDDVTLNVEGKATKVGTGYPATVSLDTDGDAVNYWITNEQITFRIVTAKPDITEPTAIETPLIADGTSHVLINAGKEGTTKGTFEYAIGDGKFSTDLPEGTDATDYLVKWKFVPTDSGYETVSGEINVTIAEASALPITITVTLEGWTYGGDANTPQVEGNTCKGAESFTYYTDAECTTQTTTANGAEAKGGQPTNAGTYYVKAVVDPKGDCGSGTATTEFVIEKKKLVMKEMGSIPSLVNTVYNGEEQQLITPGVANGTVKGTFLYSTLDGKSYESTPAKAVNVGQYNLSSKFVPEDEDNYLVFTFANISRIKPDTIDVIWDDLEQTYTGKPLVPTVKVDETSLLTAADKKNITAELVAEEDMVKADKYNVKAKLTGTGSDNYVISTKTSSTSFVIKEAVVGELTLKITLDDWTYGGDANTPQVEGNTCKGAESFTYYTDAECATLTTEADGAAKDGEQPTLPGIYYVKATVEQTGNCAGASKTASFVISKKEIKPLWQTAATGNTTVKLKYNGEAQAPTVQLRQVLKADTEDVTYKLSGKETNAGEGYAASIVLDGAKADRYVIAEGFDKQSYDIVPDTVDVIWDDLEQSYTGKPLVPTVKVDEEGLLTAADKKNITAELVVEEDMVKADKYHVKAKLTGTGSSNYVISTKTSSTSFVINEATIEELPLKISLADWSYGDTPSEIKIEGNECNGNTQDVNLLYYTDAEFATLTTEADGAAKDGEQPTKAGHYYIIGHLKAEGDCSSSNDTTSFYINQKKLSVSWDDIYLKYTGDSLAPTAYFKSNPFIGNDDVTLGVKGGEIEVGDHYATAILVGADAKNYVITNPRQKYNISKEGTNMYQAPEYLSGLVYTGEPQYLMTDGQVGDDIPGHFVYVINGYESTSNITVINAGEYYVSYRFISDTPGNNILSPTHLITVAPRKVSVLWSGETELVYNTKEQTPKYTLVGKYIDDLVYANITGGETKVGEGYVATITELLGSDRGNYTLVEDGLSQEFSIVRSNASDFQVPTQNGWTYDGYTYSLLNAGKENQIKGSFSYKLGEDGEFTDTIPATSLPGSYKVGYKFTPEDDGYYPSDVKYISVEVAKKTVNAVWEIPTVLPYTGKRQLPSVSLKDQIDGDDVSIKVDSIYAKVDVGTNYEVVAELTGKDAFKYNLSASTASTEFAIISNRVPKPIITQREFIYEPGKTYTFVEESPNYVVTGYSEGTEPGSYSVSIVPSSTSVWNDGTKDAIKETFVIKRIPVDKPAADTKKFYYNGEDQTYELATSDYYTISGNVHSAVGSYLVTVSLNDKKHYEWSDFGSTQDTVYKFSILTKSVKLPTADSVTTYIYDGVAKDFSVTYYEGSVLSDSNAIATNVGVYYRTVSLDMDENGGYEWEDGTTEDKTIKFEIKPQPVIVPVVIDNYFIHDGSTFTFEVPEDTAAESRYHVDMEQFSASELGTYIATVVLNDKDNYVWDGGSVEDIEIEFIIGTGQLEKPILKKIYSYTGKPIVFLASSKIFTVENGTGIDAGSYDVTITPNEGFTWLDGSTTPVVDKVRIIEKAIDKPEINTTPLTYDGTEKFRMPTSEYYDIYGDTTGILPGKYVATLVLKPNYMWNDSTKEELDYKFEINKIKIPVPHPIPTVYTYDGTEQIFKIEVDSVCKVIGGVQVNAGLYSVDVVIDSEFYVFENNTTKQSYRFEIMTAEAVEPYAPQTKFDYDGTEHEFVILEDKSYVIDTANARGTEAGSYDRKVSLVNTSNYIWSDGTRDPKTITFIVQSVAVPIPTVEERYKYTGKPITFIEETEAYYVTNGVKSEIGVYEVVVTLNPGYFWTDGSKDPKTFVVEIYGNFIMKPDVISSEYEYDGKSHSFGFEPNSGYTIIGDTAAVEPGTYPVKVKLNSNFTWEDGTRDSLEYIFTITKVTVAIPLADATKFIYNGEAQNYHVEIPEDSLFTVSDTTQTLAGKYVVTVALKDADHYQWSDTTSVDREYSFVINPALVALPTAPTVYFIYDNEEKHLFINPNDLYVVDPENEYATEADTFKRKVSLVDPKNYTWVDGTVEDKTVIFIIGTGELPIPEIPLAYEYTGYPIVFIPEDAAYTLENGTQTNVGDYVVKIKPNDGYHWEDGTDREITYNVVIKPIEVKKPQLQYEYTYSGKVIDFNVPTNEGYKISGTTSAKEAGKYKVILSLLPNYAWSDGSVSDVVYVISIGKKIVPIPPVDTTVFVYNGNRQTYNIAKSNDYYVVGNVESTPGTYEVKVILTDNTYSMWSDSTIEDKTYVFIIERAKVDLPTAVQDIFKYDGETKYFNVTENSAYEVLGKNASAVEIGTYERIVTLKDTINYTWIDGTTTDKIVKFEIGNGVIDIPEVTLEHIYSGKQISFVPESGVYEVENGKQTNVGTYEVVVTLKDGFQWSDETTEPKKFIVVIKPLEIEKPMLPTTTVYTYNDSIYTIDIPLSAGYLVDGTTQAKEPGVYALVVKLNSNYAWIGGSTESIDYIYTINKIAVAIPAQIDSVFKFEGTEVIYPIADTLDEYTVTGHHRASAGLHFVTVTLNDTVHYMWEDKTNDPKIYEFWIDRYKVNLPVAIVDSFIYDGDVKLFDIYANENYIAERRNASAVEAGVYYRKVSLVDKSNYLWPDGTSEDKYVAFYILEGIIPSITIPSDLVYTGDTMVLLKPSVAYSLANNYQVNAGTWEVIVTPNPGFTWASDSSKTGVSFFVTIHPQVVEIPVVKDTAINYNGMPQTFEVNIPKDSVFTVSGNVQSEVGYHKIIAELKNKNNYIWSDNTNDAKIITVQILDNEFTLDTIKQSSDMALEATPGHTATLDVKINRDVNTSNDVYKYWVTCDSCPSLNVDTTLITSPISVIDIFVPDTVKPGVYKLKVSFMSGSLDNIQTQEVEFRVNYPAADIYLVWNDVLTIDNTDGLFNTYQWYKNGVEIPGATKQYYQEIEGLDGYYSCLVNGELFVGPLFFHNEKPLWIKAYGGKGTINVEVVGDIPERSKIGIYKISSEEILLQDAEQYMTFEMTPNAYIVRLVGPDPAVNVSTQSVKVLVK